MSSRINSLEEIVARALGIKGVECKKCFNRFEPEEAFFEICEDCVDNLTSRYEPRPVVYQNLPELDDF